MKTANVSEAINIFTTVKLDVFCALSNNDLPPLFYHSVTQFQSSQQLFTSTALNFYALCLNAPLHLCEPSIVNRRDQHILFTILKRNCRCRSQGDHPSAKLYSKYEILGVSGRITKCHIMTCVTSHCEKVNV